MIAKVLQSIPEIAFDSMSRPFLIFCGMLTKEQFRRGLATLPDKDEIKLLEVLRLHYRARNHSITATEIKNALGLSSIQAVNSLYTRLGKHFAKTADVEPERRGDGTKIWWTFTSRESKRGSYILLTMHPELVEAFEELNLESSEFELGSNIKD